MSRDGALGQQQHAQDREDRADREVGHRPGGADRDPPPARLEPRLRGVHERVREDHDELEARRAGPGARTTPSPARARSRARPRPRSARAGTRAPPSPNFVRDHERRAVAPDDQVDERAEPGDDQRRDRVQRRAREQHPAAAPVERARTSRRARSNVFSRGLNSRRRKPCGASSLARRPCPRRRPGSRARRGRRAAARAAARPAGAEALLGDRRSGRPASACRRAARTAARRCRTAAGTCCG